MASTKITVSYTPTEYQVVKRILSEAQNMNSVVATQSEVTPADRAAARQEANMLDALLEEM